MGVLHGFLRVFLGARWQPLSVCFSHGAPHDTAAHRRFFGPVVEFDQEFNGIVFYATELDTPNTMSDPLLRGYARQYFDSIAVSEDTTELDRVRELIEVLLPTGRCSIEQVMRQPRRRPPDRSPAPRHVGGDVLLARQRHAHAARRAARGESEPFPHGDRRAPGFLRAQRLLPLVPGSVRQQRPRVARPAVRLRPCPQLTSLLSPGVKRRV